MRIDETFKSSRHTAPQNYHLACGFYTTTYILFEEENVLASIECTGEIKFRKPDDFSVLASATMPKQEGGRGIYMDVTCSRDGGHIVLQMPIYSWTDHYPNCDGESDRWTTETIGFHTVRYSVETGEIAVAEWRP